MGNNIIVCTLQRAQPAHCFCHVIGRAAMPWMNMFSLVELSAVDICLLLVLLFLSLYIILQLTSSHSSYPVTKTNPPLDNSPQIQEQAFSLEQLRQYDGSKPNSPIYLAIRGKVYDVSTRSEFYGPGGAYHIFAGRDASRALAKGSLSTEDVENSRVDDLLPGELEILYDWEQSFQMKYPVVGWISQPEESTVEAGSNKTD